MIKTTKKKNLIARAGLGLLTWTLFCLPLVAQDAPGIQRVAVPLSDPARPAVLHASLLYGGIEVEAHDGDDVQVEVVPRGAGRSSDARKGGMRQIPNTSLGLTVEEVDNVVRVQGDWASKIRQLKIRVPRRTSVHLGCTNDGDIRVRGLEGELELQNTNGAITALDIDGWVVAHTTNGDVKVTFERAAADKSMSFITFNGDVDVTFPGGLTADLHLNAGQGEIYTDFEFTVEAQRPNIERSEGERVYRVTLQQEVRAAIGGGGPEMHFKTFNGDIFIREGR